MSQPDIELKLVAVLLAAMVNMAVGWLWYAPLLFGKPWLAAMGWSMKELQRRQKRGLARAYGWSVVASLVLAYFLGHCVVLMGAQTLAEGALVGFWLWLGFIVTTTAGTYLFEGRPIRLYAINVGYHLASFAAMGGVLAVA